MIKKLTLSVLLISSLSYAVDIWKADIAIKKVSNKITDSENYICSIDVHNNGDDDAHSTKVVVMLPLDTKYIDFNITKFENKDYINEINCSKNTKHNNQLESSYIECSLNSLAVDANISIDIKNKFLDTNRTNKSNACSAFIFSISPDGDLTNNYKTSK